MNECAIPIREDTSLWVSPLSTRAAMSLDNTES
jgi:hypothetical protein